MGFSALCCLFATIWSTFAGSLEAQRSYMQGCIEFLRRLNAYNAELWVKGPNKNRISIAFSIEGNSGMHTGDPATAFDVLADRPYGARGALIDPRSGCNSRIAPPFKHLLTGAFD